MSINKNYLLLLFLAVGVLFSCKKKDDDPLAPVAGFSASKQTAVVDEEIQFTNSSANATAFQWSFGDGTTSAEASPKKAYATSENFTVTLVATGEGGSNTSTVAVKVLPKGAFSVENEGALIAGTAVQFTNGSKGAASYLWNFGDAANSTSTEANPKFTYAAGGTFEVTLKSISAVGETVTKKTITVAGAPAVKELFFIEYGNNLIKKLTVGSPSAADVLDVAGKAGPGMAVDEANGKIYFSDFEVAGSGNIWRMNLDGSNLTAIVSNLTDPYGLALDLTNGKIYWADDLGNISRANLDGSGVQTGLVNIAGGGMRAVALDVENNKMYFYEVQAEILYSANLDGTDVKPIVTGAYGYAILVDTVNDKLYFDDQNTETLIRSNLDGSGKTTIDATATRIYGMAIDHAEGKIYWSGRDSGNISRANLDGSGLETLASGLASPRGIALKK